MSVAVISRTGERLMPTSEYRARRLLKSGKAMKYCYNPFTIKLTERETGNVQPIELCVDTGYVHIGMSVKSEKHEYLAEQIDTLTDEKNRHDACRMYRRQRRSRKRYRQPRFDNRKREEGWIAPSLEHKKQIHIQAMSRINKVMPITDVTMEMGNFDIQVLKAIFVMGQFHPKHRAKAILYKKKHRNNRCLEKFYDAKYIDSRDGLKKTGQELFNGRISRNHKKDSENLHRYRMQKVTAGRRAIRRQHYCIQPHDIVVYEGRKYKTAGCHHGGTRIIILPDKKSVSIKKVTIYKYAGGYFKSAFNN